MYVISVVLSDETEVLIFDNGCEHSFKTDSLEEAKKQLAYMKNQCPNTIYKLWYCVESKDAD